MGTEYKVLCNAFCLTSKSKARKIEAHLNTLSAEGWEFAAIDPLTVLGTDVGFYLILKRTTKQAEPR